MNMKKKNYLFLMLVLFFTLTIKVNASTCSSERSLELSSLANNVNVSYQVYDKVIDEYDSETFTDEDDTSVKHTYPGYYLTIYNLIDDLNVTIQRDDTQKVVELNSSNKNEEGIVYVDTGLAGKIKNYTVKIRSNDSNCQNEILKTVVITTPMYNDFSKYEVCQENPEFNLCQEFTTVDYSEVSNSTFMTKLDEYKKQKAEDEKKKNSIIHNILVFLNTYKWYIIIPIIVLVIAIIVIYIIRRKKSRLV